MEGKRLNMVLASSLVTMLTLGLFSISSAHKPRLDQREPVCLKEYPSDPSLFKEYVRPYVKKIIERHGLEEWKAVLLTNELHRHLGMWSIIGAKMGIRAREV